MLYISFQYTKVQIREMGHMVIQHRNSIKNYTRNTLLLYKYTSYLTNTSLIQLPPSSCSNKSTLE